MGDPLVVSWDPSCLLVGIVLPFQADGLYAWAMAVVRGCLATDRPLLGIVSLSLINQEGKEPRKPSLSSSLY